MKKATLTLFLLPLFFACKHRNPNASNEPYFSAVSFIGGQVHKVDSTLGGIMKVETVNGHVDSSYIKREDFRKYAADFLQLPDISTSKWKDDYEESNMYDDELKSAILTYTTREKANQVRREDVIIQPNNSTGNSDVRTIVVDQLLPSGDSTVEKHLVWQADQRFLVVTKVERPGRPENVRKLEVIWNDFKSE
jgi:hypothetical protein